jgi:hypothetical protein
MRKIPPAASKLPRCRFGPFVLPNTSEFHLNAESMRIGELTGNSEELTGNRELVLPSKLLATIAWDRGRKRRIRRKYNR